ncbi:MAG: type II toxin-antitoxin system VapC family toxin [Archaeoglobaceae archaeon]
MVKSINEGEKVAITIVQLSQIANILENYLPIEEAFKVEEFLLFSKNVRVYEVTTRDCLEALQIAKDKKVGLSDSIAYTSMLKHEINEIYSFDGDLDNLEDIKRITEI